MTEIKFEIEATLPSGERFVHLTLLPYNGDIVNWDAAQQRASVKKAWRSMSKRKGDRLVAFHVPTTRWRRVTV